MSRKEQAWHARMGTALNSRHLVASCLWNQENPIDEDADEYDRERHAAEESLNIQSTELNAEGTNPSMTLGRAIDLHAALGVRLANSGIAGEAPLDIVDAAALEYLGNVLGISPIAERRLVVAGKFESGTITYQGSFERLRTRLKLGISMVNGWGEHWPAHQNRIKVLDVKAQNVRFTGTPAGDMDLQTTRVSGDIEFTFVVLEEDEATDKEQLLSQVRVAIDPAQAPAPVQRVGLKDAVVISEELT